MYAVLGGVYGALLSVMNLLNAQLAAVYGNWGSTVIIHGVGLLTLLPLAFTWGRPRGRAPWYLYGGGLIGIITVACCNLGISGLGVTANLVLMLLGQLTCSTIIDQFGLLGARRVPLTRGRGLSLAVIALGDVVMLLWAGTETGGSGSALLAIAVSFLSGFSMVLARISNARLAQHAGLGYSTVMNYVTGLGGSLLVFALTGWKLTTFSMVLARISNARLAQHAGLGYSTVMNYVTGLGGSLLVFALTGWKLTTAFPAAGQSLLIYLGGALGALAIFLCNLVTPRLSTLQFTVILFVGQLFASMLLDALLLGMFSMGTLAGGIIVALGMALNTRAERKEASAHGNPLQS